VFTDEELPGKLIRGIHRRVGRRLRGGRNNRKQTQAAAERGVDQQSHHRPPRKIPDAGLAANG
jgi:hypothetical protein